jgi:hypothetical protein
MSVSYAVSLGSNLRSDCSGGMERRTASQLFAEAKKEAREQPASNPSQASLRTLSSSQDCIECKISRDLKLALSVRHFRGQ